MKPENKYPWKEETGRLKEKEVNKPIALEEYLYLISNSDNIKQLMEIGRTAQFSKENKEITPEEQEKITKDILEKALELSNENLETRRNSLKTY